MRMTWSKERSRFEIYFNGYKEYQEHGYKVKNAGFRYDKTHNRCWWTENRDKASLLISCSDEECQVMLSEPASLREKAINASRAETADLGNTLEDLGKVPFPFQNGGIAYGLERDSVLFGDEPGLGKTLQSLAVVHLKKSYPCLAIVPATLRINWKNEAVACIPELREDNAIQILTGRTPFPVLENSKLVIIGYDVMSYWLQTLRKIPFASVIVDECHMVKNSQAKRTIAVKSIATGKEKTGKYFISVSPGISQRYLLSGTPMVSRPKELLSILEILGVFDKFGCAWRYLQRYCDPYFDFIWVKNKQGVAYQKKIWNFDGCSNEDELQLLLRQHVMVRRLKSEVMKELPPKRFQVLELPSNGMSNLLDEEIQIQNDYAQSIENLELQRDWALLSNDAPTFEEACANLTKAHAAAFQQMSIIAHKIAIAKIPYVVQFIKETLEGNDQLVAFAYHHDLINGIMDAMEEAEIKAVKLTGEESPNEKQEAIDDFQKGDARLFVGGLRAAGLGLTLVAANVAILAEMDWTPGVMDQAADRIHRIGQDKKDRKSVV